MRRPYGDAMAFDGVCDDGTADMAARGVGAAALGQGSEGFELRLPTTVKLAQTLFSAYLDLPAIRTRLREVRRKGLLDPEQYPRLVRNTS